MNMNYKKITKCRACGGNLKDIISLGKQTSVGFTDKPTIGVKIPLDLVLCGDCHLLQLKHTTNQDLLFNENYGYWSGVNATMKEELANIVSTRDTVDGDIVVDIGCNDGTLLSYYPPKVIRVGFDPSLGKNKDNNMYAICKANISRCDAAYKLCRDYFSAQKFIKIFGKRKAKVVTAIAMFYDLADPNKFLQDIYEILADNGTLIIQQNYLVGMLKNTAFDNVCHEHLEYYSLTSLIPLLEKNGFEVFDVEERAINGGSFRTYIQKKNGEILPSVARMLRYEKAMGLNTDKPYMKFAGKVAALAKSLRKYIQKLVNDGKKIYVYGASTRGNSLLQVCGIDNKLISGAAERNPIKYGKYTAGTKIKIIPEAEARTKADYFLVLPWFFKKEFIKREKEFILKGRSLIFPLPKIEVC
jgi:NDP-4-keto-2,6-dideoxyhexose 3-C-methyltransferase